MTQDERGDDPDQPSIEELVSKIEQSPLGPMLRDERAMERMICDLMASSDNRVVREMGRELRDGNVSWRGLGEVPAYREALEGSAERIGELNLTEISEQLDALDAEHMQTESADDTEDEEAGAEELWQGFGRPLDDR